MQPKDAPQMIWPDWLSPAITWAAENHVGDVASILGVLVALIGFGITAWAAVRAKSAAESAKAAADQIKEKFNKFDAIASISEAIAIIEESKRHLRANIFFIVPDRCGASRRLLIAVRRGTEFSEVQLAVIQAAVSALADIERRIESTIQKRAAINVSRMNKMLTREADNLTQLLADLKVDSNGG